MTKRNFDNFIDGYLDYTKNHEASPKIHKWTAISTVAAALERKVWLDREYYTLFPNLFILIIGKSGLVKKSTSTAVGVNLLRSLPNFKFGPERLTASTLIESMAHCLKKEKSPNGEIIQSALYLYASELKQLMEEVYGDLVPLLTTFYDCVPNDPKSPWVYRTKKDGEVKVYGPCLNILGCSTEAWLKQLITENNTEGGFSSRLLFVVEKHGPEKPVAWPKITNEMKALKPSLIEDLKMIYALRGEMKPNQMAIDLFEQWYNFHMKEVLPKFTDPRFAGYMGRKGDILLKLAMVKSAASRDSMEITAEDMVWAGEELESLEETMFDAFGSINDQDYYLLKARVSTFIRFRVEAPLESVDSSFVGEIMPHTLKRMLNELEREGQIYKVMADDGILVYRHKDSPLNKNQLHFLMKAREAKRLREAKEREAQSTTAQPLPDISLSPEEN